MWVRIPLSPQRLFFAPIILMVGAHAMVGARGATRRQQAQESEAKEEQHHALIYKKALLSTI